MTFLVDPSMYAGQQHEPRHVYGDLDQVVRTDLFYHYSTPICAQRWLDVCADPAYGHVELMRQVEAALPAAAIALRNEIGPHVPLDIVSLGTGDGEFDSRIVRGLEDHVMVASYCGMDFSFELLRRAVSKVAGVVGSRIPVRATCGDFTDASACGPRRADQRAARLFALTGFTLGNYPEDELIGHVRTMMDPGDYLFLDARVHGREVDVANNGVLASYDLLTVRRFVFGPVELATHATVSDVEFEFDVARGFTTVPNAVNVLIRCHDLDTTLRLTGRRVRRETVDLAVTTSYSLSDLKLWVERQGFDHVWTQDANDVVFLLLRKT